MAQDVSDTAISFSAARPAAAGRAALLNILLANRGVVETEREAFLIPDYEAHTHDPFLLKDMERAAARVCAALRNNERIVVYTDYDTDGIPAGVIWNDFFKKIGFDNFEVYIPHRHDEGFGVHLDAVQALAERGASLIITADCGIADVGAVAKANKLGVDVIITDHHLPNGEIPPAHAIINPKQGGDEYPFKELCGAAVTFKLIQAVLQKLPTANYKLKTTIPKGWDKWLLDMVGIATLSDMVPLVGENRVFARYGLTVLRRTRRVGLRELFRKARIRQSELAEDDVGFVIGPRINVASRMDSPEKAFRLLATDDEIEAIELVGELEALNNKRKGYVAAIVKEARRRLADAAPGKVIVLGNTAWQPGVLGLAANTLMQEHARPVFLWGEGGDGTLKGSCRSDGSVHLLELMQSADGLLDAYGGHAFSGGFSIKRDRLHLLADALAEASASVERREPNGAQEPDAILTPDDITPDTYDVIQQLAPYGEGNPKPLFVFQNMEIKNIFQFGKQKNHLKLIFQNSIGREIEAIKFFAEDLLSQFEIGQYVNLLAHIEKDTFSGRDSLRLRIVEVE